MESARHSCARFIVANSCTGGTGETFYRTIVNLQGLGVLIPHPYLKLVFLTAPVREVTFMDKVSNLVFREIISSMERYSTQGDIFL